MQANVISTSTVQETELDGSVIRQEQLVQHHLLDYRHKTERQKRFAVLTTATVLVRMMIVSGASMTTVAAPAAVRTNLMARVDI